MMDGGTVAEILVLDDEALIVEELLDALQRTGIVAIGVATSDEARSLLAQQPNLLVLVTDLRLPDGHGADLAMSLARSDATALELVLITGAAGPDEARSGQTGGIAALARESGALAVLRKPFALADFTAICHAALLRARQRRLLAALAVRPSAPAQPPRPTPPQSRERLRQALESYEILPWLQPILAVPDAGLVAFEALARWNDPTRGLLLPADFLPDFRAAGLAGELDLAILRQSLRVASLWHKSGQFRGALHVNLSADSLTAPDIREQIAALVSAIPADGVPLWLEISEATAKLPDVARCLRWLRDHGAALAVDDFGTAPGSLGWLTSSPFTLVKLDRTFLCDQDQLPPGDFLRGAADFVHAGQRRILAVGVENLTQWQAVRDAGIDLAQGYGMAMPLDVAGAAVYAVAAHQRRRPFE